jgi:L-fuconolactonase
MSRRIDAHLHFWQLDRGDYGWLTPALAPLWHDFLPADSLPLLDDRGIDAVIAVQAAPSLAETRFLLDLARQQPRIEGVVGWVDMAASDAADRIAELAQDPVLKGIRPMLQDLPADDWMLEPALGPAFAALIRHGLRFDALVKPRHLPHLLRLVDRYPELPLVVDHGAKPDVAAGAWAPWRDLLRPIAAAPQVHCKLSGLVTEAGPGAGRAALDPYAAVLLDLFGADRLMFGSDWPVVTQRMGYADWHGLASELTGGLDPDERDAIFGGTACRFYGLS